MIDTFSLKQVIENLDAGVVICNNNKEIVVWNKKAEDIIGVKPDVTPKEKWLDYFKVFDYKGNKLPKEEYPFMKASKGISTTNQRILVKNDSLPEGVYCSMDSFPVLDDKGSVNYGAVVFHDITADVKLENFLKNLGERFDHMKKFIEDHISTEEKPVTT